MRRLSLQIQQPSRRGSGGGGAEPQTFQVGGAAASIRHAKKLYEGANWRYPTFPTVAAGCLCEYKRSRGPAGADGVMSLLVAAPGAPL